MVHTGASEVGRRGRVGVRSLGWHLALLGVSGVLLGLAFPQPGWGWLAHAALVPAVVLAVRSDSEKRLAWSAYAVGLAWWLIQLNWLGQITVGGYAVLSAYLAVYWPVALLAMRALGSGCRVPMTLAVPLVWVSLEVVRTYFPAGGFNWFALAHSQAPYDEGQGVSWLIQVADVFGDHGVSFIVGMTNGVIADFLLRPWMVPGGGKAQANPSLLAAAGLWAVVVGAALGYGYYRVEQFDAAARAEGLRIAVVQTNVPQDNKNNPTAQQMLDDWHSMIDLTRRAAAGTPKPGLIVWPETMVPAALNKEALAHYESVGSQYELFHEQIGQLAGELGVALLVGSHAYYDWVTVRAPDGQGAYELPGKRYNSVYLYGPDGRQAEGRYDKIHRVPFGEYIPWVEAWPWLKKQFIRYLSPYEIDYTVQPGRSWTRFEVSGGGSAASPVRVSTPICFEDAVARVTRRMVYDEQGAKAVDVLVNLTNDGWYAGTHQGPQHMQVAVFRCVETRVPMARSVNTGVSGFIDSVGRVGPVVRVDGRAQAVEGFASHAVGVDDRVTWFSRLGHGPAVGMAVVTGCLIVLAGVKRRRVGSAN